jgi:hypothetical protein
MQYLVGVVWYRDHNAYGVEVHGRYGQILLKG